ncbi:MAG: pyruvate kinase, partial [bacterium]|nr:pyruvate kinase [bacterium]
MKRAKIVCTIGPASGNRKTIAAMLKQGMDVARLNFSHGTPDEHRHYFNLLRHSATALNRPLAIMQDLQGIKIRIGKVQNGTIRLISGSSVTIKSGSAVSTADRLSIPYPNVVKNLRQGDRILIDDGMILLKISSKAEKSVTARVIQGGELTDHKGVNLPDSVLRIASFTAKDKRDLDWGIATGVDWVAVSFVRSGSDIRSVRRHLGRRRHPIPIIAKIERPEAVANINEIMAEADGIMIARGDLGVEMQPEEVPVIQKKLIALAGRMDKVVITATQMLESMTDNRRPTRAEVNDVANAVIDGSDGLMLSAETSVGGFPVEAVKVMKQVIAHTEKSVPARSLMENASLKKYNYPYAVADAAARAARDTGARA